MKIHLVKIAGTDTPRLVKSHTRAGAEKFVRDSIKPVVSASVPTQQELVDALKSGVAIEDATADPQASIPEPSQATGFVNEPLIDVRAAHLETLSAGQTDGGFGEAFIANAQADAFDPYAAPGPVSA